MSGRSFSRPRQFALAFVCGALALLSNSCSRAVHMSVVEPADLTALPAEGHAHGAPIYARADSSQERDDGLLIAAGDSLRIYDRFEVHAGIIRSGAPPRYQFRRVVRELDILGYQSSDGPWHSMEGVVRARDDSLELVRWKVPARGLRRGSVGETVLVQPGSLSSVDLDQVDPGDTVVTFVLVAGVIAAITVAALLASPWGALAFY